MRRFFLLILALMMVLALAACHEDHKDDGGSQSVTDGAGGNSSVSGGDETVNAVPRSDVQVLTGISVIGADGSKSRELKWSLLERRLLTSMTAATNDTELSVEFAYREEGKTAVATGLTSGVTVTFAWDDNGRIVSILEKSNGGSYSIAYVYDEAGRCTERSVTRDDALASRTELTYNDEGKLLTECTYLPDGKISGEKTNTYNDQGDLIAESSKWMGSVPSVKKYSYTYDENGRPSIRITSDEKGKRVARLQYTYDDEGRVLSETSYGSGDESTRIEYTYDDNGNLIQEKVFRSDETAEQTTTYTYEMMRMSELECELYHMLMEYTEKWY